MGSRSWEPVLEGQLAGQAVEAVRGIAASLGGRSWADRGPFLGGGTAGAALFFAYLARAGLDEAAFDQAVGLLEEALNGAWQDPAGGLYGGVTGVGWVLSDLAGTFVDVSDGDPGEAIDAALAGLLARSPWEGEYDLIGGLAGFGVYALARLPRPAAARCVELVVARLAETAERQDGGIAWFTPPQRLWVPQTRAEYPQGYYDVGVAHGVPGVAAFLGEACAAGLGGAVARELLGGAVAWILAQRLPAGAGPAFPYFTGPAVRPHGARNAWCYGDPGVAAALLAAAQAVGEPAWADKAVTIARRAAAVPGEGSGVTEGCLCHGTAGLGHLFNRLFHATGDPAFAEAAREWFGRTFAYLPLADPGFLEGAAGAGLALLAAVTGVEPCWDRVMVLPRAGRGGRGLPDCPGSR